MKTMADNADDFLPMGGTQEIAGRIMDFDNENLHGYRITISQFSIMIHLEDHGDCQAKPGSGSEIAIEVHGGVGKVYVYSDINLEDAAYVIDMEDALEDNRDPDPG